MSPMRAKSDVPLRLLSVVEEDSAEAHRDLGLLQRLLPYMRPHGALLLVSLLLMPVAAAASLFQPYLLKRAIDAAVVHQSSRELLAVVVVFAASAAVEFFARFGQSYTMQLAGQRALSELRLTTFRHIHRLALSYIDRTPIGRLVTRVTNDVDALAELFGSGAIMAVGDVLMLAGIVGFMLYLDWELSLVSFIALPPLALGVNAFRKYARTAFREIRTRIAQLNAYLAEQIHGITVVQAFGREERCADEYRGINAGYRDANVRAIRADALLYSVVESVAVACVAIVLWYAARRAGAFGDSAKVVAYIGTVVAFYEYIQRFFIPIRDLSTKYTIVQSSLAAAERIFGLLDVDELDAASVSHVSRVSKLPTPDLEAGKALAFRDVRFAYRPGFPVLEDVDLSVRRGESVALVGATGSGKTTVASLFLRLYEPQEGSVIVLGRDVRTYERRELRRLFSVVPQEVFLFAGTVLENVVVGDATADEARAADAVRRVGLAPLLEARGGLAAVVADRGGNFSAGERQLVAFARALYRDPPFLILDEATANIDSDTEARLQAAVGTLTAGRTSLVIAHRLSTIRDATRIVVMHRGRVVEEGSHADLLLRGGTYARLYRLQFGAPS